MKLIMNADDFGYSRAVNWGILDAYNKGIIRSATLMANMPGFSQATDISKKNKGLGIGIHLVLTCGNALTGANRTITDEEGKFLRLPALTRKAKNGELDLDEIESEYTAQIERVLRAGINPTHLDSHHHTHMLPGIIDVFCKMAKKYKLPVRILSSDELPEDYKDIKTTDAFRYDFFGETVSADYLKNIFEEYQDSDKLVEIMCHPAYIDQEILNGSSYNANRTLELSILCSDEIIEYITSNGIELVNYRALA